MKKITALARIRTQVLLILLFSKLADNVHILQDNRMIMNKMKTGLKKGVALTNE